MDEESHHGDEEVTKKKKKKHKSDNEKAWTGEEGKASQSDRPGEEKSKKRSKRHKSSKDKSESGKEKKAKKKKSRSKGFYNLDDYSKRKRNRSVSPIERLGLGYQDTEGASSHSTSGHQSRNLSRSESVHRHHHRRHSRSHSRSSHSRDKERRRRRSRSRSPSVCEKINKEKLLQIAKANLSRMIKAGTLPKGVDIDKLNLDQLKSLKEKNSISQWSEYCRALSVMEAVANENSGDSDLYSDSEDDDENSDTKSVCSAIVRHPFQLKERKDIQINVRDFAQLPTRSSKEIQKELTEKFPVSFGDVHRIKELEWVEVKPTMPPPAEIPEKKIPEKRMFKEFQTPDQSETAVTSSTSEIDQSVPSTSSEIGTLVALRLSAKKKLQVDPLNVVALKQMYESERLLTLKMQEQAFQAQQTAAAKNLETVNPVNEFARAGIDQFSESNRIKDGIGMHLLLKMGWQPGQGLGKNQKGAVDPIIPSLKFDTRGLVAGEETVSKIPAQIVDLSAIADGRNPVSLLQEHCSKKKWLPPVYDMVEEVGPDHKKSFIMKCIVNGVEYRPSVSCGTKKQAKALAATVALQSFGLTG